MSFRARVGATLLTRGGALLLALVSSVLTARWLGPEGRGIIATLGVLTGVALQIGNLGLHSSGVYALSREPGRASAVLSNLLVMSLLMGSAGAAALMGLGAARPSWIAGVPQTLVLVTAAALPFQFMILLLQNALLGLGDVRGFNLFEIVHKAGTFAALALFLVVFGGTVKGAVVIFALAAAAGGVASVWYCRRHAALRLAVDAGLLRGMVAYGARAWAACLLAFLLIRADMLLVAHLLGSAAAGVYSIAVQAADTLLLVPSTIGMILMPRIAASAAADQDAITSRVSRHAAFLLTGVCGAAALVAAPAVALLYGPDFAGAVPALLWLLPGVWALGMNGVLMNHFAGQGLPSVVLWAPLAALGVNVALNLRLIPAAGVTGAAIASSISYALMLAISLVVFLRRSGTPLRRAFVATPAEIAAVLGLKP